MTTRALLSAILLPLVSDAVRVGLGPVWLTDYDAGTVWRLDPRRVAAVRR